jgi:outer membrane cobalamin receptor
MKTIFLLVLSLAAYAGESNNFQGVVLDSGGWPVEGARVECQNQAVYSNAQGRFRISGMDRCSAMVTKSGFETRAADLDATVDNKIELAIAARTETMVVSATRSEITANQAAVSASVIDAQDLAARDYPMLFDVLREIPGLSVSASGAPGSLVSVFTRGANSTDTLVLLDGVPLNDPGGQINFAHLSSEGLDRVEIVRGPESALFGAEASSGVIQLFTKRGDPEQARPHGSLFYERGNFQTDHWIVDASGGLAGRFDYYLSAAEFHTVGPYANNYDRDNTGTADLGYRISNATQVRGVFHIYDAHLGVPGQTAYGVDDLVPNEETRDSTASVRVDDSRGANYQQQFTFGFHRLNDRYNDDEPFGLQPLAALVREAESPVPSVYFVKLLNPAAIPAQVPAGLTLIQSAAYFGPADSVNLTERKTAGYQGTYLHRNGAIVFGYNYQRQSGELSGVAAERDNNGLFFHFQQSVGSRLFLSGGARYEHSSAFGNIGSGRAGASFVLAHEHGALSLASLRVDGGRGVIEPSLLEDYAQSPYFHGNPALRPAETTTWEAGVVVDWWHRRVRTEATAFRSSFNDLIAFVGDTWQNIQASWGRGVETSLQARLTHDVSINATYMRLYTRITASTAPSSAATGLGEELIRRPRNSGSVSLAISPKRWSFIAGARLVGERQDDDFTFGTTRNPGYQSVFASASYQLTKHLTPVLRLDNLLNESDQEVLGYPALSRTVLGGVRIAW